jgi:uncharacterized membrane protein required for colicin V production
MLAGLGWLLQLLALVIVGAALLVGLVNGAVKAELWVAGCGAAIFLAGRWLQGRGH